MVDNPRRRFAGMDLIRQREMEELVPLPSNSMTGQVDNGLEPIVDIGEEAGAPDVPREVSSEQASLEAGVSAGTPISSDIAFRNAKIRTAGSSRINALIEMFGEDAFVLQHVFFRIPPLAIKIRKQNLNYKWKSLRTKDVTVVPSGNGECYIDIPLIFVGERELKTHLAELIKVFKIAPFAFIENKFIRDNMIPDAPEDSMAVQLESLHLSARSGRPDAVSVNLSMKWFNYKPYSHHFWFRRDWVPFGEGFTMSTDDSGEEVPVGSINEQAVTTSIVDLSQIENPENLDLSLPPEARLPTINEDGDPGDITISPTQPVVYPFNSGAFLKYVRHFTNTYHGFTFDGWNDQMRMRWNSYRRVPWPRNILDVQTEGEAVQTDDNQPSRRERTPNPPPVTGRDVVLFVGDSITVGYLGVTNPDSLELRDISSSIRSVFRDHSSFSFYALAKVGQGSTALKSSLTSALSDSTFADRVAGVVIACGVNDGAGSSTVSNITEMANAAKDKGAIVVLLPLWPISDPVEGDRDYGKTVDFSDAAKATLSSRNDEISALGTSVGPTVVFRNTHTAEISTDPQSWGGLWPTTFRQITGSSINVHPNIRVGYSTIAGVVNGLLPWDSFSGSEPTREDQEEISYSVIEVLDGDTILVRGPEGEIRVRFNYIDAPEIGQAPWGERAKDYLTSIIEDSVNLQNTSRDRYGRTLAEVLNAQNGFNLNLKMVTAGYAAVYEQYASTSAQSAYYSAQTAARTGNLQIWSTPGLHQTPWEWRRINDRLEI